MAGAVVELEQLSKTFGKRVHAVRDVSLTVPKGEVYGFLGPNGAGKSTAIRMLLGLIRPSAGHVRLWGQPVGPRTLKRVGSLVDGGTFYPFLSGRKNLRVLARTEGVEESRIDPLLEQVGLTAAADRKVKGYSTGMRQRLGVAAALLNDPELVILDEPANGLDAEGLQEMRVLIRRLGQEEGKTVFLSSHLLHEVEQLCDRVAIVAKGRVLREATIGELLHKDDLLTIEASPLEQALGVLDGAWPVMREGAMLRVTAPRAAAPEIVRRLVAANVEVFGVAAEQRKLEEVFLSITQPEADIA
jgi:ABC-2 type transport system ATP-binding protein